MVSVSLAILAHHFSCFLANLICQSSYFLVSSSTSWSNSSLNWTFAWLMLCNHIRARWNQGPSSAWEPSFLWGWGKMREPTVLLDQIGNALPQSSFTRSPGRGDTPLTLPLPPMAGPPQCQSMEVPCIGIATPVGIWQMKHPQERGYI